MTRSRARADVLIAVSVTEEQAEKMRKHGPRRDFDALAAKVGGTLVYQAQAVRRRGVLGRLLGPHMLQAWRIARRTRPGHILFADGEHVGLPLLLFLHAMVRRPDRVVMLGHLPGRMWKLIAFAVVTRLWLRGTVLVHSVEQERILRGWLGPRWSVEAVPYQVDTAFWTQAGVAAVSGGEPNASGAVAVLLAVGSEHRDYRTLAEAARGLPVDIQIAAGSHWARTLADIDECPPNVEYIDQVLDFEALRERYRSALAVVVPLLDVPNQSGVTTILEAMSVGIPVIVTATQGQRECVVGPLVRADGTLDTAATNDRGPYLFGRIAPGSPDPSGLYVSPGDPASLRSAIQRLLDDADLRAHLGANAERAARDSFTLESFAEIVGAHLSADPVVPVCRSVAAQGRRQ